MDYLISNGQGWSGQGDAADKLIRAGMDPGALRPFVDKYGRNCISLFQGYSAEGKELRKTYLTNAPATLEKETWKKFDDTIVRVARPLLSVWGDIVGAGLTYNVPNGMGVTVIQHQSRTDFGEAGLSMDGLRRTNRDKPLYELVNLPLPIVHGEFSFTAREIAVSQRQRIPLDMDSVEQVTRKCVEQIEKLTLGKAGTYSYGGGTIYGLTNYPDRITFSMTLPTAPGWTPEITTNEIIAALQSLRNIYFNGPYIIWYSPAWSQYFDRDYSAAYQGDSLMTRLMKIKNIRSWRQSDYLGLNGVGFEIVIAQATSDVIQAVTGMRLQTVSWDNYGGLEKCFKIWGIMVPRLKSNASGDTGIAHGLAV